MGKTLVNCSRFTKFAKVFHRHRFAQYGITRVIAILCLKSLVSSSVVLVMPFTFSFSFSFSKDVDLLLVLDLVLVKMLIYF